MTAPWGKRTKRTGELEGGLGRLEGIVNLGGLGDCENVPQSLVTWAPTQVGKWRGARPNLTPIKKYFEKSCIVLQKSDGGGGGAKTPLRLRP